MALVPIKTASETGYCDCICGCYELANLRDDDTSKGYCPRCAKEHLAQNSGVGISQSAPGKIQPNTTGLAEPPAMPLAANPPGRFRQA
jgi:hypothetical protein